MNLSTVPDKIVFSILKDIKVGHLELTNYDGKNYSFGKFSMNHLDESLNFIDDIPCR